MSSKLTPEILRRAQEMQCKGVGVREAAAKLDVGKSQLAAALAALAMPAATTPPQKPAKPARAAAGSPPPPAAGTIDATGSPLSIAREMLEGLSLALVGLATDEPAYVRLSAEARQCTKLIAALEREAAGEETAEELARRRRREDGATRREIEKYVDQQLAISLRPTAEAPCGKCPTCANPLTHESRVALVGS